VLLSDGSCVAARTVVWTAGTAPHMLLGMLPCAKDAGRLKVNEFLEVEGYENVWALGDCARVPDTRNPGKFHPPTAQHALRQGKVVANNLIAAVRGGKKRPFDFVTLGQLAAIGRRTGVAKVLGLKFSGFAAWFLWRTIYLSKLPRFEKKLRVALDWTLDLFFSKDLVQVLTVRGSARTSAAAGVTAPPPAASKGRTAHDTLSTGARHGTFTHAEPDLVGAADRRRPDPLPDPVLQVHRG
jgi:NADH dehydrogenase